MNKTYDWLLVIVLVEVMYKVPIWEYTICFNLLQQPA